MRRLIRNVAHFSNPIGPSVHDNGRRVCGQYNLYVGIEREDEVDESLLPVDMQAHFGFVHEEHVVLSVLDEHGEQDDEHLLLAARQLIRAQNLAYLREAYLVLSAYDSLARLREEVVDEVLECLLRSRDALRLKGGIGTSVLQTRNDAVADIDLIVEIFALQEEELHVEFGGKIAQRSVELADSIEIPQRTVERTYNVVAYPLGIVGLHLQPDALEHVARKLATCRKSLHHLI